MSYDTERRKSGKHPFSWVEAELERCSLTYGTAPCTAVLDVTGEQKCFNSWVSCQDPDNFDPEPFWVRFAEPVADLPRQFTFDAGDEGLPVFLPLLAGVQHRPGLPDPGESIGARVQVTVHLEDAPHHDVGMDKYLADRAYDPMSQGTLLGKLKARFPHYLGRRLRWYQGYIVPVTFSAGVEVKHAGTAQAGAAGSITLENTASETDDVYNGMTARITGGTGTPGEERTISAYDGDTQVAAVSVDWSVAPDNTTTYEIEGVAITTGGGTALTDFQMREYVMERFEGPDGRGRVSIVAKDPLKLLDDDRAQVPRKSTGVLESSMAEGATPATVNVLTEDDTEYDLKPGDTEDYVRLGKEVATYTGTTPITGGVQLTGYSRITPAPYVTEKADHDAGDLVQRCRYLSGRVDQVAAEIMTDYGELDAGYIPTSEWEDEALAWAPETIERLITEPEGCRSVLNEIIGQTLTWGFWWDEVALEVKYRAMRPADVNDTVAELSDAAGMVAGSINLVDEPDRLKNEVQVLYGQRDPTEDKDEAGSYAKGFATPDADSQGPREAHQRRIKRVFGVWWPGTAGGAVQQFAERTLSSRAANLRSITLKAERKDEGIDTAQFADITSRQLQALTGAASTVRFQVIRAEAKGEEILYRAREDFFRASSFRRLAPVALETLLYDAATGQQKATYLFLADGADQLGAANDEGHKLA